MESPQFEPAVRRFIKLLDDLEHTLTNSSWLAGNEYSLADIAYSPYMLRLEHLGFGDLIEQRSHVSAWKEKLYATQGFVEGITHWLDAGYLEIFDRERPQARNHINRIAKLT
jgi:glutathione S-transferase